VITFLYNLFFNRSQFKLGETTEPKKPEFSSIVPSFSFGGETVIRPLPILKSESTLNENMSLVELKKKMEDHMKVYITVEDILTSSGKYPERAEDAECTNVVKSNAAKLCDKVNNLFTDLKYQGKLSVTSGFRTTGVNKAIPNAAKKSLHMSGQAVDFSDPEGKIDALLFDDKNDHLLKKYGLWLEHPDATKYWSHCDIKDRGARSKNVFKP
jgi:hypothetical protein